MKKRLVISFLAAALLPFCISAGSAEQNDSPKPAAPAKPAPAPAKPANAPLPAPVKPALAPAQPAPAPAKPALTPANPAPAPDKPALTPANPVPAPDKNSSAPAAAPAASKAPAAPSAPASLPKPLQGQIQSGHQPVKAAEIGMSAEMLSISTGEKRVLTVPFRIDSCKTDSSNVKIEHVSGNTLEISGATPGRATVTVVAGGMERQYKVTVFNSTLQSYQELSRLLEELPEITLELYDGGLVLRGVITRPAHWSYFRRIILPYEQNCHNYVSFMPDANLIAQLKQRLTGAGFPVTEQSGPQFPGNLSFHVAGNVLTISGHLLSEQAIASVKSILSAQQWLNPEWNGNNFRAVTNLTVAPTQIDLGIVFVGVTRTQLERLGNSSADGKVLTWDVIGWFKALYGGSLDAFSSHGDQHAGGSAILQSNLKGSLLFFGDNGITDFRDSGHITLTNNGAESSFENGGTRNVKVYGENSADLKEIKFGLNYKASALLQENNMVKLNLELERSLPPIMDGNDYIQRTSKTKTSLLCPLGKTAVIAGQKELTFTKSGPAGYAFLRHIPVINWFASFEEDTGEQMQILVLVSPELMHQNTQMATRPSMENATLEKDVAEAVSAKTRQVQESEKKSRFQKMFEW